MTHPNYYATTSRNLDRVLQYLVYPIAQTVGMIIFRKHTHQERMASDFARYVSTGIYSMLTTEFLGAESEMIDQNSRTALSAELGIDPKLIKFSDFKYSDNAIIRNAHQDMMKLQFPRYFTDALFVLPTVLRGACKVTGHEWPEVDHKGNYTNVGQDKFENGHGTRPNASAVDMLLNWHNGWNMSVYGGKAAYWAGETFLVDKSGYYEIVKIIETLASTGKDMSFNDLLGVYQRTRHNEQKLNLIDTQQEYDAIRPLLQRMANAYNKHDGKFGISEIVYLFGLNKINIHAPDNVHVSEEAIAASNKEIDKVIEIGLDGIREEKRKYREQHGISESMIIHPKSFADRFGDSAVGIAQSFVNSTVSFVDMFRGKKDRRVEEWTSVRNPGDLAGTIGRSSVHR